MRYKIIEVTTVIQGEGRTAGSLSVLVRTTGCPLRCEFKDSKCDTAYASWKTEEGKYEIDDVEAHIERYRHLGILQLIITGGEPLMHTDLVLDLIKLAHKYHMLACIETSGAYSLTIGEKYRESVFFSISPKLSNSDPHISDEISFEDATRHKKMRCNYKAMKHLMSQANYQIKFVISKPEDFEEIETTMIAMDAKRQDVLLMPEGITKDQIDAKRKWVMEACIERGYSYSDRLHVLAWDNKRYV